MPRAARPLPVLILVLVLALLAPVALSGARTEARLVSSALAGTAVQSGSYTSPTYGYTVLWDAAVWQEDPAAALTAAGADALDRLLLNNPGGSLYVEGARRYDGDVRACVPSEASLLGNEAGIEGFEPLPNAPGVPIVDEPDRAGAAFRVTLRLETGNTVDLAYYIECRAGPRNEYVVISTMVTTLDGLPALVALARPVIDGIALPGGGLLPDDQILSNLRDEARQEPSVAGPLEGSIPLAEGTVNGVLAGVELAELYATATFGNPYPAAQHPWDFGFGVRIGAAGEQVRLVVDSAGTWFVSPSGGALAAVGQVEGLDLAAGGSNTLEFATNGDTGYFAVNGRFVGTVDLASRPEAGDVFAGSGFFAEDVVAGEQTGLADFEVWSLEPPAAAGVVDAATFPGWVAAATAAEPVAGPLAGELALASGAAAVVPSGATRQDFYATVQFETPTRQGAPWDAGLAFRDQTTGEHYRLVIDARGRWTFAVGLAPDLASGAVRSIALAPGAINTLELVVVGSTAGFAVNGQFVAALDTAAIVAPGGVWFGAGFDRNAVAAGGAVRFRGFSVWSLEGLAPLTAPAATPGPTPSAGATPAAGTAATPAATPVSDLSPTPTPAPTAVPAATIGPPPDLGDDS